MFLQVSSQTNHFWVIWEKPISFYLLRPRVGQNCQKCPILGISQLKEICFSQITPLDSNNSLRKPSFIVMKHKTHPVRTFCVFQFFSLSWLDIWESSVSRYWENSLGTNQIGHGCISRQQFNCFPSNTCMSVYYRI